MKKVKQLILLILVSFVSACSQTPQDKAEDAAVRFSKAMYGLEQQQQLSLSDLHKLKTQCHRTTKATPICTMKVIGFGSVEDEKVT